MRFTLAFAFAFALASTLLLAGCGSAMNGNPPNDAAAGAPDLGAPAADGATVADAGGAAGDAADLAPQYCVGPASVGNDVGVGAWCTQLSDCADTPGAHICAALDDVSQPYCTRACDTDGGDHDCGLGAVCAPSRTLGMLCVPLVCLQLDGGLSG